MRAGSIAARLICSLVGACLVYFALCHRKGVKSYAAGAIVHIAAHIEAHLRWFGTAKPAGVKLHAQLSRLLADAGTFLVRQTIALGSSACSFLAPAALCFLGAAFVVGGAQAGMGLMFAQLYLCTLPLLLPYAVLAVAYRWHVRAVAFLWDVFTGQRGLLLPAHPGSHCLAAEAASVGTGVLPPSVREARQGGDSTLPHHPHLANLTASILLLVPVLLLLPTLAAFYGLACVLHGVCLAARLALASAMQTVDRAPEAATIGSQKWQEGKLPPPLQQAIRALNGCNDTDNGRTCTGGRAGPEGMLQLLRHSRAWHRAGSRSRRAWAAPSVGAVLKSFASGVLVGTHPLWPWQ